jgi:polyphosphate glucokinase
MLFLGLGTGLGSTLVVDGVVIPMELAHLSYRKGTFEDYIGIRGLQRLGKKKWRRHIEYSVSRLVEVLHPDDVVLGGGNAKKLKIFPAGCRLGSNANAFLGGFRLWEQDAKSKA